MADRLTCPQGHHWEPTPADPPTACPVCGDRHVTPYRGVWPEGLDADLAVTAVTPALGEGNAGLPTVPGYEILERLGHGGMGVVYKARQVSLNRLVALKMLRSGPEANPDQLARFRIEAEAVARLHHSNIVQIYEVGEHAQGPYFSLEFMEGGSLDRRLGGKPLPPPEAAGLVEVLARAIHYAHQQGIVHRDLKPANILLSFSREPRASADDTPALARGSRLNEVSPKITDFGLAKLLTGTPGQTKTGEVMGTPSYMAPEQAGGVTRQVTPSVDVYALGAVLYELLTGRAPFLAASPVETVLQVIAQDPVPPRRLHAGVPRDLETICLRCLEKTPRKRYPSAEALADDLHRFRQGEPITARPVGTVERLVKWARRRPAVAALITLAVVSLFVIIGGVTWSNVRLQREIDAKEQQRERAERETADKERERRRAETYLRLAYDGVSHLTEVSQEALDPLPNAAPAQRRILEAARAIHQAFLNKESGEPGMRQLKGRAARQLGLIEYHLGQPDQAERLFGQAIEVLEPLVTEHPDESAYQQDLARTYNSLGNLLIVHSRRPEAEQAFRRSQQRLAALTAVAPDNPNFRQDLAMVDTNLAGVLTGLRRFPEAQELYQKALAIREELIRQFPTEGTYRRELASSLNNLGKFFYQTKQPSLAEQTFRRALDEFRELPAPLAKEAPCREKHAQVWQNLAQVLRAMGQLPQAAEAFRKALGLYQELHVEFPGVMGYREEEASLWRNVGMVLIQLVRPAEAVEASRHAVDSFEKLVADFPDSPAYLHELAISLNYLGEQLIQARQLAEAEPVLRRGLEVARQLLRWRPEAADAEYTLGLALHSLGYLLTQQREQWANAQPLFEEAIVHQRRAVQLAPTNTVYRRELRSHYHFLALAWVMLRRPAEVAATVEELPRLDPDHGDTWYEAADLLAYTLSPGLRDPKQSPTEWAAQAQPRANRVMELLRQAVRKGFTDAKALRQSPRFAPLRSRKDFQDLLKEMEQTRKP